MSDEKGFVRSWTFKKLCSLSKMSKRNSVIHHEEIEKEAWEYKNTKSKDKEEEKIYRYIKIMFSKCKFKISSF